MRTYCAMDNDIITINTSNMTEYYRQKLYNELYNEFDKNLLRKIDSQELAFAHHYYRVSFLRGKGFLLWWDFPRYVFVEYLLVYKSFRNLGIGSQLLCEVKKTNKIVIIEVNPDDTVSNFYRKNGFVINNYSYSPIQINSSPPPNMILMTYNRELSPDEYTSFLLTITAPEYQF